MSEAAKKVGARELARQKIAAQREARRQRDEANEKALVELLRAQAVEATAAAKRDKAIAKAEATYRTAVADAEQSAHAVIAGMRERGESVAEISELTDLSEADVRKHIAAHKNGAAVEPVEPATTTADSAVAVVEEPAPSEPTGREALGEHSSAEVRERPVGEPVSVGGL